MIGFVLLMVACATAVLLHEPAHGCYGELRREIENQFAQSFADRQEFKEKQTAVLNNPEASEFSIREALGKLIGQRIAESFARYNYKAVGEALHEDCRMREMALNDPCVTITYDYVSKTCIRQISPTCFVSGRQ